MFMCLNIVKSILENRSLPESSSIVLLVLLNWKYPQNSRTRQTRPRRFSTIYYVCIPCTLCTYIYTLYQITHMHICNCIQIKKLIPYHVCLPTTAFKTCEDAGNLVDEAVDSSDGHSTFGMLKGLDDFLRNNQLSRSATKDYPTQMEIIYNRIQIIENQMAWIRMMVTPIFLQTHHHH